jgi:hypothetical protein
LGAGNATVHEDSSVFDGQRGLELPPVALSQSMSSSR